jgi:hypothetical protein
MLIQSVLTFLQLNNNYFTPQTLKISHVVNWFENCNYVIVKMVYSNSQNCRPQDYLPVMPVQDRLQPSPMKKTMKNFLTSLRYFIGIVEYFKMHVILLIFRLDSVPQTVCLSIWHVSWLVWVIWLYGKAHPPALLQLIQDLHTGSSPVYVLEVTYWDRSRPHQESAKTASLHQPCFVVPLTGP